jgi:hypothetical protein
VAKIRQTLYHKDYIHENDPFAMLNDGDSLTEWEQKQAHLANKSPPYDGDNPKVYGHPKGRQFINGTWQNLEHPSRYTNNTTNDRSRSPP